MGCKDAFRNFTIECAWRFKSYIIGGALGFSLGSFITYKIVSSYREISKYDITAPNFCIEKVYIGASKSGDKFGVEVLEINGQNYYYINSHKGKIESILEIKGSGSKWRKGEHYLEGCLYKLEEIEKDKKIPIKY